MAHALVPSSPKEEQLGGLIAPIQGEIQSLLKAGTKLFRANEDAQALGMFKKAYVLSSSLPETPTQALCLFNLGSAYIATGKPEKALRCLQKAKRTGVIGEQDSDFCFNVAAAYERMENYRKAAKFYRKAIGEPSLDDPQGTGEALVKLGYCLVSVGQMALAGQCFRLAGQAYQKARLAEEAAMALREAANYSLQSAKYSSEDVLEVLRTCKLYNDLGLHYVELGHFEAAERCFQEALLLCCGRCAGEEASEQRRAVLLQNLGAICNVQGHFARSLRYHSALGESQRSAQAQSLYNLATAHGRMKNHHMADFYYRQARKAFAQAELGTLRLRRGDWDLATGYYKEALGLFGKSKETSGAPRERIRGKLAAVAQCGADARSQSSFGNGAGSGAEEKTGMGWRR
ncbi:hypothetical protein JD844_014047 [Phrynosoma platyrhinos]|uniref:Tetratricopeptide repeat domain 24 n=1 Tax=Phrynosoma platyrhinos TaxID=52577 RepID=A0ABQ7SR76_PHRPL|nr:hypothetical protein JD844_014047 [Phrynosoma platyrhinos]